MGGGCYAERAWGEHYLSRQGGYTNNTMPLEEAYIGLLEAMYSILVLIVTTSII